LKQIADSSIEKLTDLAEKIGSVKYSSKEKPILHGPVFGKINRTKNIRFGYIFVWQL